MTSGRKLAIVTVLFVVGIVMVVVSNATKTVGPLFVAWLPLVGVAWVLTRPEPQEGAPEEDLAGSAEAPETRDADAGEPEADEEAEVPPDGEEQEPPAGAADHLDVSEPIGPEAAEPETVEPEIPGAETGEPVESAAPEPEREPSGEDRPGPTPAGA